MKRYEYVGLIAPWVGIIGIFIAIAFNTSWWSLTNNAISDLGNIKRPWVNHPYILNTTLMLAGAMVTYYLVNLFRDMQDIIGKIGCIIFLIGGISLFLIGVFPEEASILGFEPHYYVSWGFFLLSSFGMLIIGIAALLKRETRLFGLITAIIFVISWILAIKALRTFKGVAIAEFIGAFALFIWLYLALLWKKGLPSLIGT